MCDNLVAAGVGTDVFETSKVSVCADVSEHVRIEHDFICGHVETPKTTVIWIQDGASTKQSGQYGVQGAPFEIPPLACSTSVEDAEEDAGQDLGVPQKTIEYSKQKVVASKDLHQSEHIPGEQASNNNEKINNNNNNNNKKKKKKINNSKNKEKINNKKKIHNNTNNNNNNNNSPKEKPPSEENEGNSNTSTKEPGYESQATQFHINTTNTFVYCSILALAAFPLGWDVGTISNVIAHAKFPYQGLTSLQVGIVISSFNAGCLLGCSTLARQKRNLVVVLRVSTGIYLSGSLVELGCLIWLRHHYAGYAMGRLLCGVCCGTMCVIGPLFMNELLMDGFADKGTYLGLWQCVICALILLGNCLHHLGHVRGTSYVYAVHAVKLAYVVVMNGALFCVPDSVGWTVRQGRSLEHTLNRLIVGLSTAKQLEVSSLLQEKYQRSQPPPAGSFTKQNRNRTIKCCCLMAFQQLTGINYFFYYGASVLATPSALIILSAVNVLGSVSSGFVLRRASPRLVLLSCSTAMCIAMTIYSSVGPDMVPLLVALSCLFIFSFAVSWGPCSGMLTNAIASNSADITSVAVAASWMTNWVVSLATPVLIERLGFKYGYLFSFFLAVMAVFVYKFVSNESL